MELAELRFEAAASLTLLQKIREEMFTSEEHIINTMMIHDKLAADANHQRSRGDHLSILKTLVFLARCFCTGRPGDCIAAVFGKKRHHDGLESLAGDGDLQDEKDYEVNDRDLDLKSDGDVGSATNDGEDFDSDDPESNGEPQSDEGYADILDPTQELLNLSISEFFPPALGSDDFDFQADQLPPSSVPADTDDNNHAPPETLLVPSEVSFALILANNRAEIVPPFFVSRSQLVKQVLRRCILLPDVTTRWYHLIILGRECCAAWVDERFRRLLQSLYLSDNSGISTSGTRLYQNLITHLTQWDRDGGGRMENEPELQEALAQLHRHFPFTPPDRSSCNSATTLYCAILSLLRQHCDGKNVNLAKDRATVPNRSFSVLLLAMVTFGESGPMNDIGQVPTSDSQDEVGRRCFRRRWLRIGNLACQARHVAVSGIPLFQSESGEGFDHFEILNTRRISPLDFIHELPRGVPASMPQLQWEDILNGAWQDDSTWNITFHVEPQVFARCADMGFVVVHNVLGVTKRPCLACDITLSTLAPDLRVPFGSKKPYPLWALPDRFPSTAKSDVRDVVAGIKKVLRNALGQHPPQAPGSMNRRENTSDSSYGSLGGDVLNLVSRQVDWEMLECL
ncbi:hypothetical protein ARMGADRAFT_1164267 [Armillaria gallica]|uniref:Uncharacterized protein n=1 Tax=Armillaria gallica TaxID=47427 RepID=A0A2H3DHF1_ARMGA|nr:hypothetical protein ARMGADRAFT_1164267 [Armillaria gallica]